jgi:hypothetical protein
MTDTPEPDKNSWLEPENAADAEIRYLVENTDLSPLQAKELVAKHGTDRDLADLCPDHEGRGLRGCLTIRNEIAGESFVQDTMDHSSSTIVLDFEPATLPPVSPIR